METKKRELNPWLFIGFLTVLVWGLGVAQIFMERPDIWWTPKQMAMPFMECRDRVRILIGDRTLEQILDSDQLLLVKESGQVRLNAEDIRLRLNNWDARRASRYGMGMVSSLMCGAGIMMIIFGLIGKGKKKQHSDIAET